jgi:hypothetical protein
VGAQRLAEGAHAVIFAPDDQHLDGLPVPEGISPSGVLCTTMHVYPERLAARGRASRRPELWRERRSAGGDVLGEAHRPALLPATALDQSAAKALDVNQRHPGRCVGIEVVSEDQVIGSLANALLFVGEKAARTKLANGSHHTPVGAGALGRHGAVLGAHDRDRA